MVSFPTMAPQRICVHAGDTKTWVHLCPTNTPSLQQRKCHCCPEHHLHCTVTMRLLKALKLTICHLDIWIHTLLQIATGLGYAPSLQVWTAKMGQFDSGRVQHRYSLTLGRPNLDPYLETVGFPSVWPHQLVAISSSAYHVSHLWSHSDMLLLIIKYWHWYFKVYFGQIGHLND